MQHKNREQFTSELTSLFSTRLENPDQVTSRVLFDQQLNLLLDKFFQPLEAVEMKYSTILFTDLRGFTHVSEKYSPNILLETLNRYLSIMIDIIEKHGGKIDKFIGDAIMVVFATDRTGAGLADVLTCAIEMQNAMTAINEENQGRGLESLHMGIGINTGEVLAGYIGSDKHLEYTVIGDEVNIASRVESFTMRG